MARALSFEDELETCIKAMLRKEYPFTYTSIINDSAATGARAAIACILSVYVDWL